MIYLKFSTYEEAKSAEEKINQNIKSWIVKYTPDRLSLDGKLLSISAIDGSVRESATPTQQWANPQELDEGWIIPKPTLDRLGRIPLDAALAGVGGGEIENPRFGLLPTVEGGEI